VTGILEPQFHQESAIIGEVGMTIVQVVHLLLVDTDEIDPQIIMMVAVEAALVHLLAETLASEMADVMNLKMTYPCLEEHLEMYQKFKSSFLTILTGLF
jgi:hypothetical protein